MNVCAKCGREIIFRTNIDGRPIPIHVDGHCNDYSDNSSVEQYRNQYKTFGSYVNPNAKCPECGKQVFFYQSESGGKVYFDELGPPWPKHVCTDNYRKTKVSSSWLSSGWKPCILKTYSSENGFLNITVINPVDESNKDMHMLIKSQSPRAWASDWNGEPMLYKNIKGSGPTVKTFILKNGRVIECTIRVTVIPRRHFRKRSTSMS